MFLLKLLVYVLILGTSSGVGILLSYNYIHREKELKDFKNALNIFKTKVKFTYEPVPTIFNEIGISLKGTVGTVFTNASNKMNSLSAGDAWNRTLDEKSNLNINKEDKEVLKTLSKLLRKN